MLRDASHGKPPCDSLHSLPERVIPFLLALLVRHKSRGAVTHRSRSALASDRGWDRHLPLCLFVDLCLRKRQGPTEDNDVIQSSLGLVLCCVTERAVMVVASSSLCIHILAVLLYRAGQV